MINLSHRSNHASMTHHHMLLPVRHSSSVAKAYNQHPGQSSLPVSTLPTTIRSIQSLCRARRISPIQLSLFSSTTVQHSIRGFASTGASSSSGQSPTSPLDSASIPSDSSPTATGESHPIHQSTATTNDTTQSSSDQPLTVPGYDTAGSGLPRGTLPYLVAEQFPDALFDLHLSSVLRGLAIPLALMAVGYGALWWGHSYAPLWQQLLAWIAIGTGYTGIFTVAHTASHYALMADADPTQDIIGSLLMAPALVAFNPWRDRFLGHIATPNMLQHDPAAWQPVTVEQVEAAGPLLRMWLRLCCTTPLKLLGSVAHWCTSWGGMDLKAYQPLDRRSALLSWAAPMLFMGFAWPSMVAAGGLAGWASWWLMPWLVFHAWLSTLTLLQHTAPHIPFRSAGPEYDMGQAVISGTVTVSMPRWLELLLNDANYHLPQHISPAIPFYHARAAQQWLSSRLGPYLTETKLSWGLLSSLMTRCQVWDEQLQAYRPFQDVEAELVQKAQEAKAARVSESATPQSGTA